MYTLDNHNLKEDEYMRRELSLGTIITLHSDGAVKQFHIDQVIGSGASCIAYEAHQVGGVDHNKRFRIKECYPHGMNVSRENDGLTLIWGSDGERNKAFSLLKKAHELILLLRNDDAVGNNVTSASLFEGNGTLYSVMEVNHALTYDHVHEENLSCILETVLTLTKVVGNLHDQGYLHLDTEMISHYENRLKRISGVYFEKKGELKTSVDEEETDEFDWNID